MTGWKKIDHVPRCLLPAYLCRFGCCCFCRFHFLWNCRFCRFLRYFGNNRLDLLRWWSRGFLEYYWFCDDTPISRLPQIPWLVSFLSEVELRFLGSLVVGNLWEVSLVEPLFSEEKAMDFCDDTLISLNLDSITAVGFSSFEGCTTVFGSFGGGELGTFCTSFPRFLWFRIFWRRLLTWLLSTPGSCFIFPNIEVNTGILGFKFRRFLQCVDDEMGFSTGLISGLTTGTIIFVEQALIGVLVTIVVSAFSSSFIERLSMWSVVFWIRVSSGSSSPLSSLISWLTGFIVTSSPSCVESGSRSIAVSIWSSCSSAFNSSALTSSKPGGSWKLKFLIQNYN